MRRGDDARAVESPNLNAKEGSEKAQNADVADAKSGKRIRIACGQSCRRLHIHPWRDEHQLIASKIVHENEDSDSDCRPQQGRKQHHNEWSDCHNILPRTLRTSAQCRRWIFDSARVSLSELCHVLRISRAASGLHAVVVLPNCRTPGQYTAENLLTGRFVIWFAHRVQLQHVRSGAAQAKFSRVHMNF